MKGGKMARQRALKNLSLSLFFFIYFFYMCDDEDARRRQHVQSWSPSVQIRREDTQTVCSLHRNRFVTDLLKHILMEDLASVTLFIAW